VTWDAEVSAALVLPPATRVELRRPTRRTTRARPCIVAHPRRLVVPLSKGALEDDPQAVVLLTTRLQPSSSVSPGLWATVRDEMHDELKALGAFAAEARGTLPTRGDHP
jgi:hypothetical protein